MFSNLTLLRTNTHTMNTFQDAKQSVVTNLEQIQTSRIVGVCFLDSDGRLIQLIEEDPALKEAIVEHYEDRLRQMNLFEREVASVTEPTLSTLMGSKAA